MWRWSCAPVVLHLLAVKKQGGGKGYMLVCCSAITQGHFESLTESDGENRKEYQLLWVTQAQVNIQQESASSAYG